MIDIKTKSKLELSQFLKYNKFSFFNIIAVILEFVIFSYRHFKLKYFSKYFKDRRNFLKNKKLQLGEKIELKDFNFIRFNRVNYKNNLNDTNRKKFSIYDQELISNKIRYYFLIEFIKKKNNPKKIFNKFIKLHNSNKNKYLYKKDIYSASERLSNLIIFLCYNKFSYFNSDLTKEIIISHIHQIAKNIEFHSNNTNNHILNNLRSLILASVFVGDKKLFLSSLKEFLYFYMKIFNKDGSIKEGSTHYQLVIHNWIEDVYHFSINNNFGYDSKISNLIKKLKNNLISVRAFSSAIFEMYKIDNITIGDISPDLSPKFLINKINQLYSFKFDNKFKNILSQDWAIYKKNKLFFASSISNKLIDFRRTHHHNDLTSFIFFYKSFPIIIDLGRYDYTKNQLSIYHYSSFAHNSVFINGLSLYPHFFYKNFLPNEYFQKYLKKNNIIKKSKGFKIITDGFKRYNLLSNYSREFKLLSNRLIIKDSIISTFRREIKLIYNLSNHLKLLSNSNNLITFSFKTNKVLFDFNDNKLPMNFSFKKVLLSQNYGKKIYINQLIINFTYKGNLSFFSKINII